MSATKDDFEATRRVIAALEGFDPADQERIIRWAREKLGLSAALKQSEPPLSVSSLELSQPHGLDIKTFIKSKAPRGDNQFAAAVAYYYKFKAQPDQRKDSITKSDLLEACRLTDRTRITHPAQTLVNARNSELPRQRWQRCISD